MRITLNLATRPFADLGPAIKRLRIAMVVLALVAIGLGLGLRALHQKAEEARARVHSLDGQIAGITQERQGYQAMMKQPANAELLKQAMALNKLFQEKAFSWTLAMEDLETVLPSGVQVSTLEPVPAKDGQVTLHLRVIGPRDRAIDLVRNLEHSRRFVLPRIVGENAVETTGRPGEALEPVSVSNRVNFDLLAEYSPAAPEERRAFRKPAIIAEKRESGGTSRHALSGSMTPSRRPVRPPQTATPASRPSPSTPAPINRGTNHRLLPPPPGSRNGVPR
jgi:type IV pilus assembly protein PilN